MLDRRDIRILDEISKNSRITMKELGEKAHLTRQATSSKLHVQITAKMIYLNMEAFLQ